MVMSNRRAPILNQSKELAHGPDQLLRQAAVVLRRRRKPNIGSQRSSYDQAHMISCAGDDTMQGFPVFKQRHHMVGLKQNSFLMNYGSGQGSFQ